MTSKIQKRLTKAAKPNDARDVLPPSEYLALSAGQIVPKGYCRPSVPKEAYDYLVNAMESDIAAKYSPQELLRLAAGAIVELGLWKSQFANYAKDKNIELLAAKQQLL